MKYLPFEVRTFSAATASLVDGPVEAARVDAFLADIAARAPLHVAWGLRALLWIVALLGWRTTAARRAAIWNGALSHRLYGVRQLALVVKAMACLCHYDR